MTPPRLPDATVNVYAKHGTRFGFRDEDLGALAREVLTLRAAGDALAEAVERDWFGDSDEQMPERPYRCVLCDVRGYTFDDIEHEADCAVTAAARWRAARQG